MDKEVNEKVTEAVQTAKTKAVKAGKKLKIFVIGVLVGIVISALIVFFNPKLNPFGKDEVESPGAMEEHDLVLEDNVLGYTAADFQEAVINETSQEKSLIVYTAKVSDVVQLTETGLGSWKIFTKTKCITYHGTATYTVDLSNMQKRDVYYDEDKKQLTIYIPHAQLDSINTPADEMEFSDTEKGLLAFGDIEMTAESYAQVKATATETMKARLEKENAIEDADRFAKLSTWEIFQPLISAIASDVTVVIEFQ